MSLGTIHYNLYKPYAKDVKASPKIANNLNIRTATFAFTFLFISLFLASSAFAAVLAAISDGTDRINQTGQTVVWQINVTNQPSATNALTFVNITNATSYIITAANATGNTSDVCTIERNSVNCTGTGFAIAAGTSRLVNVTVTMPDGGSSGAGTWIVETKDAGATATSGNVYTLALDVNEDIGFDITDELGNVTNGSTVDVRNTTTNGPKMTGGFVSKADSDNDGLLIFEFGTDIDGTSGSGTYGWNVSKSGFVNVTSSSQSYTRSGFNGVKPSGLQYGIKITVQDELGNAISDATVNVTSWNGTSFLTLNSTTLPNITDNNRYYFALPQSAVSNFTNVTFIVSRSGYLTNGSENTLSNYFRVYPSTPGAQSTQATQQTGNSTYNLFFVLKVNVTDELGSGTGFGSANVTVFLNGTDVTANQTSNNFYYYAIPAIAVNVSAGRPGYVNDSDVGGEGGSAGIRLNTSTQALANPQLLFVLKVVSRDEVGGVVPVAVTTALNGTDVTPNSTSSNNFYFSIPWTGVNVSAARLGYINSTNNTEVSLSDASQSTVFTVMNFSIRVVDICNEIGGAGHCYTIDGTAVDVEVSGNGEGNTTYSGNDAYINGTNGISPVSVRLNITKNGYVNVSTVIITNQSTQARVIFNTTDGSGGLANVLADPLPFTFKVLAVYDELGVRNFTLNNSGTFDQVGTTQAGVDVAGQITNIFYSGPSGYVNATGTSAVQLTAYLGNQSLANISTSVTPSASSQQTVIFNHTDQMSAGVDAGGLKYILNITVKDELNSADNMDSGVTFSFNDSAGTAETNAASGGGRSYYFSNSSLGSIVGILPNQTFVNITRSGYINASADNIAVNATNGSSTTLTMSFNLKVAANDELSTALQPSVVTLGANNTNSAPNTTSGFYAYYALPEGGVTTTGGVVFINASASGYVDNSTNSTGIMTPLNATRQGLANVTMLFTVRVPLRGLCDELNITCITIDGSTGTVNSGGVEASNVNRGATNTTKYDSGVAYINATNGTTITLTAFGDGYVNRSVATVTPNAGNQTIVVFNTSSNIQSHVNASALQFSVRINSACDELDRTCLTINGNFTVAGSAAVSLAGNTTQYIGGIGYIAVPGTGPGRTPGAVTVVAGGTGYVNATNSSVTPSGSAQTTVIFNSTYTPLKYSVKMTLQDELAQSTNMNSAITLYANNSRLTENTSYFRSSPSSNVYYINATNNATAESGTTNVTSQRDGYINTTSGGVNGFSVNTTTQAIPTIQLPFSVKINSGTVTGVRATVTSGTTNYIVVDGNSSSDVNSSADGFIYWALNQTQVVGVGGGNVDVQIQKPENTYYNSPLFDDVNLNYSIQLSLSPVLSQSSSDTTAPLVTITSIAANANVTSTTPVISFNITDAAGSGVDVSTIAVNMSGFSVASDCGSPAPADGSQNISCSYTVSSALTDGTNNTISIAVSDMAGNPATNASRTFGVDTRDAVVATLNTSDTSAVADNTFANGWSFTFNVTLGSSSANATDVNATAVRIGNWTRVGGTETIATAGNTIMNYTDSSGTARTYYASHNYNTTDTIYPLKDLELITKAINGTVTVYVKIPASTTPGTYTTTFTFGSWSVAITGGNPT